MPDAYIVNAEYVCSECVHGIRPFIGDDIGETDTPEHCAVCGVPLGYRLTSAGVRYVIEHIRESMAETPESRNRIMPKLGTAEERMTYWHGSRHVEIVRSWAEHLKLYSLKPEERELVETFLETTEE